MLASIFSFYVKIPTRGLLQATIQHKMQFFMNQIAIRSLNWYGRFLIISLFMITLGCFYVNGFIEQKRWFDHFLAVLIITFFSQ